MTIFVDTNVFLRYLTRDDPYKAEACYRLLQRARNNEVELTISESIITEIVYVLSSPRVYALAPSEVRARVYPLIALEGLKIQDRGKYFRALDLFAEHAVDFEDALTVAEMERNCVEALYSYDTDFDAFAGVTRLEPA